MKQRPFARTYVLTGVFVLLWSSGAIVSEIALTQGSPFALLLVRYAFALAVLLAMAVARGRLLPSRESRGRVIATGFAIAGVYTSCYLLALQHGLRPGMLATLLGVQPLLTLAITERRFTWTRLAGLLCALGGVAMIVWDGLAGQHFGIAGLTFALLALTGITGGSILQKRETQAPHRVLPLQYGVGLLVILALTPFEPFHMAWTPTFLLSGLWLGLGISIGATFALYSLIARGNLVNVTSTMYLVPGVTALLDWIVLGHAMAPLGWVGLGAIVAGLIVTFKV
jgi:drug/metabolite transporter (DMT)-like permease